jgi:glyoxylase I family protein
MKCCICSRFLFPVPHFLILCQQKILPNTFEIYFLLFNFAFFIFNFRMHISLEHIAIVAKDPVALKNWYQRVLGAKPVWNNGQTPPTCLVSLGSVWFEIYPADKLQGEPGNNKLSGFRHLALRVDSLEAAKAELERRGVTFSEAERPAAGGGRVLFFADAEGNLLHFVERPVDFKL